MASIATLADFILRQQPSDCFNGISSVYNGIGNRYNYYTLNLCNGAGLNMNDWSSQTEILQPNIAKTRGLILEYWAEQAKEFEKAQSVAQLNNPEYKANKLVSIFEYPNSSLHQTTSYNEDSTTLQFVRDICTECGYNIDRRGYGIHYYIHTLL